MSVPVMNTDEVELDEDHKKGTARGDAANQSGRQRPAHSRAITWQNVRVDLSIITANWEMSKVDYQVEEPPMCQ